MAPGRYTELFFLDEAVGLAAGHRPCGECRRLAHSEFLALSARCHPGIFQSGKPTARELDSHLHAARLAPGGERRLFTERVALLPAGAFFVLREQPDRPLIRWAGRCLPWSHDGYGQAIDVKSAEEVLVITPRPTVSVLAEGYVPQIHPSADPGPFGNLTEEEYVRAFEAAAPFSHLESGLLRQHFASKGRETSFGVLAQRTQGFSGVSAVNACYGRLAKRIFAGLPVAARPPFYVLCLMHARSSEDGSTRLFTLRPQVARAMRKTGLVTGW